MKTRNIILSVMLICMSTITFSQDQSTALRFSQVNPIGTARYAAMGGALGAVGGSFTTASSNPAGLGLYRSSEFSFTPNYTINNSMSDYLGASVRDNVRNLSISNLGYLSSYLTGRDVGLVSVSFAFGYNALTDFHSTTTMRGINTNSSLMDNFTWYANNSSGLDPIYEETAFETFMMPLDPETNQYWHYLEPFGEYEGYGEEQLRIVERSGYVGEYAVSGALNISNKLFLGGTMGFHSVHYYEDVYHSEEDVYDLEGEFDSFTFGEYNSTRGNGYVLKLGLIYKPVHALRLGASYHLPTLYRLTDNKSSDMTTTWDPHTGYGVEEYTSELYSKDYTLRTPARASLSAAILIGKLGMISAEYEYVDYAASDLNSAGYKFFDENDLISQDYKSASNLRAGAEIILKSISLRAGAQYLQTPFTDERNFGDTFIYSFGFGKKLGRNTSIDVAYTHAISKGLYGLYNYNPDFPEAYEVSVNTYNKSNVIVTLRHKL